MPGIIFKKGNMSVDQINKEKKEAEINKIISEILTQANAALEKCRKTGDWNGYGTEINGIYRSYALASKEIYPLAMESIIKGEVSCDAEILGGNYGFRVAAAKEAMANIEIAKDIQARHGMEAAKIFVRGLNPCQRTAAVQVKERQKEVDSNFEELTTILNNVSTHL